MIKIVVLSVIAIVCIYAAIRAFPRSEDISGGIIFVGDSLIAGCNWARLFHNPDIRNQRMRANTCGDILRNMHRLTKRKPSKVFLMAGSNDLYFGMSVSDVDRAYRKIIERLLKESPDTKIYIHGIPPVNTTMSSFIPAQSNQVLQDMNGHLKQIAEELKVNYIELWPYFIKDGQLDRKFTRDGTHFSSSGYDRWKEAIQDLVNS